MGVAHHSAYLIWFEAAGVSLAVSAVSVQYHRSSRFDDELRVEATLSELRSRRVRYRYLIARGEEKIATGDSLHTPIDATGGVVRLPSMWLRALEKYVITP